MRLKKQNPKNVMKKIRENIANIRRIYGDGWQWQDVPAFMRYQLKK